MPDLALFDFDGTITTRETFAEFVASSVSPTRLLFGRVALAPLIAGYKLGQVSGARIRAAIVGIGYARASAPALAAAGERFARGVVPNVLRPKAMERIRWHRERGDTVVVVSGALDVYLGHWCEAHGLAVICSRLESRGDLLSGRYDGAQCVDAEKPRRVLERYDLSRFDEVYAYGDTKEDIDLLAITTKPYFRWRESTPGSHHA